MEGRYRLHDALPLVAPEPTNSQFIFILGRYGGEEFAIFLPGADLQTTAQIAERLRQQLAGWTITIEGENHAVTASFGVHAACAGDGTTIDELLKMADLALYQAKSNGRNQVARSC